jgi:hypothetical protein
LTFVVVIGTVVTAALVLCTEVEVSAAPSVVLCEVVGVLPPLHPDRIRVISAKKVSDAKRVFFIISSKEQRIYNYKMIIAEKRVVFNRENKNISNRQSDC